MYDKILEIASRRGFFWPSFEMYGGLSGFITYGNLGTKFKRNIEDLWRTFFIKPQIILEIDDPIINPEKVFSASGHLEHFKEYLVECSVCSNVYRADHLVEEQLKIEHAEALGSDEVVKLLKKSEIKCPQCGGMLKEPTMLLTMFKTKIGLKGGEMAYGRPETAQGMFVNFRRGFQHARERIPFGLAQIGKALRNEISPRRGIIRLREFTMMELEFFFDPKQETCPWLDEVADEEISIITEEMGERDEKTQIKEKIKNLFSKGCVKTEWQAYFMGVSKKFLESLGIQEDKQRFRAHLPNERSHYSAQTYDHEVFTEAWGWIEVAGHAYRTDYDLKAHQKGSGVDLSVLRNDSSRFIPYVIEPSFGLDRLVYVTLESSYKRRKDRNIFALPKRLAPVKISVFPLVSKDGLPEKAREVYNLLLDSGLIVDYEEGMSIGKMYARSDEIGVPIAVTIDYQSLEDETVTLRDRDTWVQVRQKICMLPKVLDEYFKDRIAFKDLELAGNVA